MMRIDATCSNAAWSDALSEAKVPTEVAKKLLQADLGVLVDSLGSFLSGPPTLAMLGTALSKLGGGARNNRTQTTLKTLQTPPHIPHPPLKMILTKRANKKAASC